MGNRGERCRYSSVHKGAATTACLIKEGGNLAYNTTKEKKKRLLPLSLYVKVRRQARDQELGGGGALAADPCMQFPLFLFIIILYKTQQKNDKTDYCHRPFTSSSGDKHVTKNSFVGAQLLPAHCMQFPGSYLLLFYLFIFSPFLIYYYFIYHFLNKGGCASFLLISHMTKHVMLSPLSSFSFFS